MPNVLEMQVIMRERLFDLLLLKRLNSGTNIKGLDQQIRRAKSGMTKEDIAYVESLVSEETV